jgi:hypothetical protein
LDFTTSKNITALITLELQLLHNAFVDADTFTKSLTTNALPKGVYYLKIQIGGDIKVEKVVVR